MSPNTRRETAYVKHFRPNISPIHSPTALKLLSPSDRSQNTHIAELTAYRQTITSQGLQPLFLSRDILSEIS
jgi:hypothetical protein